MSEMYNVIKRLCDERGTNITQMCKDAEVSRGSLTDLKMGRIAVLSTSSICKIADFFDVSTDYLLGFTDDPINYDEVDTSEFNQPVWNEILKQNNFDMEKALKQYRSFEKANAEDAAQDSHSSNNYDIKIVARHLEEIPSDKREELVETINKTIDMYKKAIGFNNKEG